jgi:PIN domain nuclease of toxin-antitoxin system
VIVLDTQVWLWWLSNPEKLSSPAEEAIAAAISEKGILISSISSWEIAVLVKRGRLELAIDHRDWISKTQGLPFVQFVPVDNLIALRSVELPGEFHADPADRIIAATAMTMAIPLITCDQKIIRYPHLQTIW